jgi:hypothetical protein
MAAPVMAAPVVAAPIVNGCGDALCDPCCDEKPTLFARFKGMFCRPQEACCSDPCMNGNCGVVYDCCPPVKENKLMGMLKGLFHRNACCDPGCEDVGCNNGACGGAVVSHAISGGAVVPPAISGGVVVPPAVTAPATQTLPKIEAIPAPKDAGPANPLPRGGKISLDLQPLNIIPASGVSPY